MSLLVLDTSAAIPYCVQSHIAHHAIAALVDDEDIALSTHSLAETFSVLTRLPGDARLTPADAARLLETNFPSVLTVPANVARALPRVLAPAGIAGGAVYDALVALAARAGRATLLTRDRRAAATYAALDVEVRLVA